eukprot:INCI16286.2.p1 GENE.INCI16286.2~~INCI16286.2.p1  ORF type:complete len:1242 (+),score=233.28 INCI16286.2:159-3728(+)
MAEAQAEAEALAKAEAEAKAKAEVQARARTEAETTRVEAETKPRTTAEAQAKLLTESKHNSPEEAEAKDTSVLPPLSTSRGPTHGPTEATSLGAPPPIVRRARRAPQPPGSAKVESVRGDVYSAKALDANANSAINPHGRYRFQVGLIIGNDVNTDEASGGQRTATVVLLSPGTMQVRDFKALVLVKTWAFNSAQDMDANHWRLRHGGLVSAAAGPMSPHATQQAEETAELGRLIVEHGDLVSSGLVPTQLLLDEAETEEQTIRVWVEQGPPCTHTPAHQLVSEPTAEIAQKQAESEAQHQRLLEEEAEQLRLAEEAAARIRALAEAEPARPDAQAEAELPAVHTAEATDSDSKVERKEEPKPVVEQEPRDIAKQSAAPCTHPPGLDDDGGDASGENDDRALKPITENVDTPSAEEGTSTGPLNADPEQLAAAAAARIRSLQTAASMASKQESPALPPRRRRHVPTPDKLESEQHVGDVHAPIGARTEAVSPVRSNDADTAADDVRALSREAPSTVPPLPSRTRRSPSIALRAVQSEQLATSNPTSEASQSQSAELAANGEAQKRSNAKSIVSTQPEPLTVSTKFASTGDQAPLSQSKVSEMPQSPTANPVSPTTARGVSNFLQHNLSTPTSHQQLLRLAMSASQIYGLPPPPGLDDESESNNAWMEQDGDLPVDTALAGKPPGVWPLAHIRPTVVGETTPSQDNNGEGVFELSSHATALFTLREQLAQEQDDVSRAKVYGALLQLARGEKEVAAAQKRLLELQEQASVQEYTKNRAVLRAKELADREAQYDQQATHFDRTCDRDERLVLRRTEELRAQCHPAASRLRISEQLEKDKLRYMESTKLAMIKLIQKETRKRSELQRRFEDAQVLGRRVTNFAGHVAEPLKKIVATVHQVIALTATHVQFFQKLEGLLSCMLPSRWSHLAGRYESVTAGSTDNRAAGATEIAAGITDQFADDLLAGRSAALLAAATTGTDAPTNGELATRVFFDLAKLFSLDLAQRLYREVVWHRLRPSRTQVDTLQSIIATARQTSVEKTFSEPMEVLRFPEPPPLLFSKHEKQHTSFHSDDDADAFDTQTQFTHSTAASHQHWRGSNKRQQPLRHPHDRSRGIHSVGSVGSRSVRSHHSARPKGNRSTRGLGTWAGSEDSHSAAGSTQASSVSRWRRPTGSTNYASPTTSSIARSRHSAR